MLITAGHAGLVAFAGDSAAIRNPQSAIPERKFSIGYLPEGSDIPNAPARMEELRQFLLGRREVRRALEAAGYAPGEIELSPCDVPRDMVQRMNDGEFDLVFATAIIYAQQKGGRYEPILQLKQPTDFIPPGQDSGALREGVIFVGPRSPLFRKPGTPTREDLRNLLEKNPLAVPSADSAVGYLSPRYIMTHDLGLKSFPSPLFCGSDAEVVKHVVSGLAEVGACRTGALKELLGGEDAGKYYRVLCKTDPIPTDPVLLRTELMPGARSELGIQLKQALREGFLANSAVNASPRDFEIIVKYLQELQGFRPAPAPAMPEPQTPHAESTTSSLPAPTPSPKPGLSPTPPLKPALPMVTPEVGRFGKPAVPAATPMKTVGLESAPTPPVPEIHPALPPEKIHTTTTFGKPALPDAERARTPALPGKPALPYNPQSAIRNPQPGGPS